jgi:hypothetical protein
VKFSSEEIFSARRILYRKLGKFPSQKELELFMADGVVRFIPQKNSLSSKEIVISPEHFVLEAKEPLESSFKARIATPRQPEQQSEIPPPTQYDLFKE